VSGAFNTAEITTDVATGSVAFTSTTPVNLTVSLGGITTVVADVPEGELEMVSLFCYKCSSSGYRTAINVAVVDICTAMHRDKWSRVSTVSVASSTEQRAMIRFACIQMT
jgi:hypothetical protein